MVKALQTMPRRICASAAVAMALGLAPAVHADPGGYQQRNLVADLPTVAEHQDTDLANAWGIAFNPFAFVWVADNHTGLSTLYDGDGNKQALVVAIPGPASPTGGSPTGIVFNGNPATPAKAPANFFVTAAGVTASSVFIFATEDGVIAGWSPAVDMTHAIRARDDSLAGAVYKGLALSANGSGARLYATDFHNNRVAVFDNTFTPVPLAPGAFTDSKIPAGFAPFGIQAINGNLYVSYAKQDADAHDDVHGSGNGFGNVFDPNGQLIRRVAKRGKLNSPWGMALAPAGFGRFSNNLLVGNFGDGRINAYDLASGKFKGQLQAGPHGAPIEIEGLWGLAFGNGFANQPVNTLFFAAGPNDETNGLYGRLDPIPDPKDDKENHDQ
jgi:uncharacterized protein (TIGR03118 family)